MLPLIVMFVMHMLRDSSATVTTFASGFNFPHGLAFDAAGNLYVANEVSFLGAGCMQALPLLSVICACVRALWFVSLADYGSFFSGTVRSLHRSPTL